MNCKDAQNLMHAYTDKELELLKSLEMDKHLQSCPVCTHILNNTQALCSALKVANLDYQPSTALKNRIHTALKKMDRAERKTHFIIPWPWLNAGVTLAIVVVLVWAVVPLLPSHREDNLLAQEVVSSHVRSLLANHLTDVVSSDQHTVKPWFSGKLDFSPPVDNFAAQGFPLIGGRLDYLEQKTVAALIYQHRQHYINLFIWPADNHAATAPKVLSRQGYQMIHWTQSGLHFWLISELNQNELRRLVSLMEQAS
jgi:anti-sigma factor RsiW